MVQGLAFLSKKGFNPRNRDNQNRVYEARQERKLEEERVRKRQDQLRKERDEEELAYARYGATAGAQAQLQFMYDVPKTEEGVADKSGAKQATSAKPAADPNDLTQVQTGDDAAAAAFRRMLAAHSSGNNHKEDEAQDRTRTPAVNIMVTTPHSTASAPSYRAPRAT